MKLRSLKILIFGLMGLLFLSASSVYAETIVLKSGKTVEGKLIDKTDKYIKIDFQGVSLTYFLDEIESIDGVKQAFYSAETENIQKKDPEEKVVGGDDKMESIYKKFCSAPIKINYKKTDYSSELIKKLAELKIDGLINNLASNVYSDNQIPQALQYLGLRLMQDKKIDDSIKIYQCAAEKYYDIVSMYRMARLYKAGTDSIKKQIPDAVITNEIKPDFQKSYFWIASLIYVELAEKTGMLSSGTQFGWNSIAMLDDLQNTGKLSDKEMVDIENSVREFIGKRYPEVLNSDSRVIKHKL